MITAKDNNEKHILCPAMNPAAATLFPPTLLPFPQPNDNKVISNKLKMKINFPNKI